MGTLFALVASPENELRVAVQCVFVTRQCTKKSFAVENLLCIPLQRSAVT